MVALANKYRPKTFAGVVGQEKEVEVLKQILRQGWRPNALMITGPFGTGKTTLGRLIARALLCKDRQGIEPCGVCESCLAMDRDNNPSYTEIDAASNGLVSDVRGMKDFMSYSIGGGDLKIVNYDESHMLSAQAQNALLQTLEEGQRGVMYIFCVDGMAWVQAKGLGLIRLKNVEPGMEVNSGSGWSKVTKFYPKGKKEVIEIRTRSGISLCLTPDHKVKTFNGRDLEWVEAKDLLGRCVPVSWLRDEGQGISRLSLAECEFLGRLIGDGYWRKTGEDSRVVGILFRDEEWDLGQKLLKEAGVEISTTTKKGRIFESVLKDGKALCLKYGLKLYSKGSKTLPTSLEGLSKEQTEAVLSGWRGADGHLSKGRLSTHTPVYHLYSSNRGLLVEAMSLAASVGQTTTLGHTERYHDGENENVGIREGLYQAYDLWTRQKSREMDTVVSIHFKEDREVYDLEVAGPASFVVNGLVVHNCTTDNQKMLPTVSSRCIPLKMKLLSAGQIADRLRAVTAAEGIEAEDKALKILATYVKGHMRDALVQLEQISQTTGGKVTEDAVRAYLQLDRFDEIYKLLVITEKKPGVEMLEHLLCNYAPSDLADTIGEVLVNAYKLSLGIDTFNQADKAWLTKIIEARPVAMLLKHAQSILQLDLDYASIHQGIAGFQQILFEDEPEAKSPIGLRPGGAPTTAIPTTMRKQKT